MSNILDRIIATKKLEVAEQKGEKSIEQLEYQIGAISKKRSFTDSLRNSDTGIIAEFKRRSPSRDWIFKKAKVQDVIPMYTKGGASAISILTDYNYFGGTFDDLSLGRSLTDTPILRKDFIVDEYQIYQASVMDADVILLIASALSKGEIKRFAMKAKTLGLETLLEVHNEAELEMVNEFIDVVGVNNRNLKTFETNVQTSFDLIDKIPDDFIKISESGISSPKVVKDLRSVGYKGFLMGDNFMKTINPGLALIQFIKDLK